MEYVVQGRNPASVFRFFEELSRIPRLSYHEERIADYLVAFAEARGLECVRDELHNVLIKAPASPGKESVPPILFQGHTDMVCEKNADTEHDFLKDPLKLYVDGDRLRAKGTTLGADNGIAVAMMMAMLDGAFGPHPAIECLFTTAEEVGLNGAEGFDYRHVAARRMVNLDSEALGWVTAGCAGGIRSDLVLSAKSELFSGIALRVSIKGLMGGHSGENINGGRANANKLMGRLLGALLDGAPDVRLIRLTGGSKDNAIPRECEALLAVSNTETASDILEEEAVRIAQELSPCDREFTLTVETDAPEAVMLSEEDTKRAISLLRSAKNGVIAMSEDIKGLVQTSRNLGVITTEDAAITFVFSSRSSKERELDACVEDLDALAAELGCSARHYSRYPGWEFASISPLREAYLRAYREVMGRDAAVNVIHAGLECGIIRSKLPDMDIISVGPTMHDIHSPDEALELGDTEDFCKTLVRLLEIL